MIFRAWCLMLALLVLVARDTHLVAQRPSRGGNNAPAGNAQATVFAALQKSNRLREEGNLRAAISESQRALRLARDAFGENETTAICLRHLAFNYTRVNSYAQALPLLESCLEIRDKGRGSSQAVVIATLEDLAYVSRMTKRYAQAEAHYQRLLKAYEAGKKTQKAVETLLALADVYIDWNKHDPCDRVLQAALRVQEEASGEESKEAAALLFRVGNKYVQLGDKNKASETYLACVDLQGHVFGKASAEAGRTWCELGNLHLTEAEGIAHLQRGLSILEARFGKSHNEILVPAYRLALAYWMTGKRGEAVKACTRFLEVVQALPDTNKDKTWFEGNGVLLLARCYHDMARYTEAEEKYAEALRVLEQRFGPTSPELSPLLHQFGHLYWRMSQYDRAEKMFLRSIAVARDRDGSPSERGLQTRNCLSILYSRTGREEQATKLKQEIMHYAEEKLPLEHAFRQWMMLRKGEDLLDQGDFAEAEKVLTQVVGIVEKQKTPKSHDLVTYLLKLGAAYRYQGKLDEAQQVLERALELEERYSGAAHPDVANPLVSLALTHINKNGPDQARGLLDRTLRLLRLHVANTLPILSPRAQMKFLEEKYQEDLFIGLSLGLRAPEQQPMCEAAATWLVNSKGLAQECAADLSRLLLNSKNPQVLERLHELQHVRSEIAKLTLLEDDSHDSKTVMLDREAVKHHARAQELEHQLTRLIHAETRGDAWIELQEVRDRLPRKGVLIDIVRMKVRDFAATSTDRYWQPAHYLACVVPPKGPVKLVDLGPADDIDQAARAVRDAIAGAHKAILEIGDVEAEKQMRDSLTRVSKLVLQPLLPHIGKRSQWIFCLDGELWLVPFNALVLPDTRYVIEHYEVTYLSTGRDLVVGARTPRLNSQAPLLVADPDFDLSRKEVVRLTREVIGVERSEDEVRGLGRSLRSGRVARLPFTQVEGEQAAAKLHEILGDSPRLLMGKEALKEAVASSRNPRVLVLSTHGYFMPGSEKKEGQQENPLLRCGLLFAGCNDGEYCSQGVLTGLEVTTIDLRGTELVVLSACETGLGVIRQGEGVASLRQCFHIAGARGVVASLWQVPDRETALQMLHFFDLLGQEETKGEALRQAQLKIIANKRERSGAAHPFFWAAFTLTGEATALLGTSGVKKPLLVGPSLESARAYVERGKTRLQAGRYRQALGDFTEALKLEERHAEALGQRGIAYRRLSLVKEAQADLDRSIEMEPKAAEYYIERGGLLWARGDKARALDDLTQALTLDPQSSRAYALRGSWRTSLKKHAEARQDLDRAIELAPRYAFALNCRGLLFLETSQRDRALEDFTHSVAADPGYKYAWYNRGRTLVQLGKYNEAIRDLTRAVQLDPKYTFAWNELGVANLSRKDLAAALSAFDKCLEHDPKSAFAWRGRAEAGRRMGKYAAAIDDATRAIALKPGWSHAYAERADSYRLSKQLDRAITDYNKAIELSPGYFFALNGRGLAYLGKKDFRSAEADFSKVIELDGNKRDGFLKLGYASRARARLELKLLDEALADVNQALQIDPKLAYASRLRGQITAAIAQAKDGKTAEDGEKESPR